MERIGIAASKIAKGNLFLYNFYVILLAFLFALLIFIIGMSVVAIALVLLKMMSQHLSLQNFEKEWTSLMLLCMIALTIVVGFFILAILLKNIKLTRGKG